MLGEDHPRMKIKCQYFNEIKDMITTLNVMYIMSTVYGDKCLQNKLLGYCIGPSDKKLPHV